MQGDVSIMKNKKLLLLGMLAAACAVSLSEAAKLTPVQYNKLLADFNTLMKKNFDHKVQKDAEALIKQARDTKFGRYVRGANTMQAQIDEKIAAKAAAETAEKHKLALADKDREKAAAARMAIQMSRQVQESEVEKEKLKKDLQVEKEQAAQIEMAEKELRQKYVSLEGKQLHYSFAELMQLTTMIIKIKDALVTSSLTDQAAQENLVEVEVGKIDEGKRNELKELVQKNKDDTYKYPNDIHAIKATMGNAAVVVDLVSDVLSNPVGPVPQSPVSSTRPDPPSDSDTAEEVVPLPD